MTTKEAIEILREAHDNALFSVRTALETLIPELVDSKDEIIRKELLALVRMNVLPEATCLVRGGSVTRAQAEAYLEKQKESGIKRLKSDNVKNPDKPYIDKAGMFYTTDGRMCYASEIEKQKEQKPEEKSINWTELTWKDINELEGIINNVHYEFRNGIGQESFGKEVLEKFREYKGDEYLDEIEQKPTEWSEEDEEALDMCIDAIPKAWKTKSGILLTKWLKDKLKSIRSSWKPSEEQMEALDVLNLYGELSYVGQQNQLISLYQDLKKL